MSTGRSLHAMRESRPAVDSVLHNKPPFTQLLQFKLAAVYPLPWWGIQTAANMQNLTGIPVAASYVATNAQVAPSLGRNLAACGTRVPCTATTALNPYYLGATITSGTILMEPNKVFEDRLTQVDIRFAKTVNVRKVRIQGMFDIYNLFNASDVLAQHPVRSDLADSVQCARRPAVQVGRAAQFLRWNDRVKCERSSPRFDARQDSAPGRPPSGRGGPVGGAPQCPAEAVAGGPTRMHSASTSAGDLSRTHLNGHRFHEWRGPCVSQPRCWSASD